MLPAFHSSSNNNSRIDLRATCRIHKYLRSPACSVDRHALRMQIANCLRDISHIMDNAVGQTKRAREIFAESRPNVYCISFPFNWKTNLSTQNMWINFMAWNRTISLCVICFVRPPWLMIATHWSTMCRSIWLIHSGNGSQAIGTFRNHQSRPAPNTLRSTGGQFKSDSTFFSGLHHALRFLRFPVTQWNNPLQTLLFIWPTAAAVAADYATS